MKEYSNSFVRHCTYVNDVQSAKEILFGHIHFCVLYWISHSVLRNSTLRNSPFEHEKYCFKGKERIQQAFVSSFKESIYSRFH